MKTRNIGAGLLAALTLGTMIAPLTANAQNWRDVESARRQKSKNDWRNLAYGSGALGLWGLLKKDNTLMFAGGAGALYSAWRYEQDRKSQSKTDRARAEMFGKSSFTRDGKRYQRRTVTKNGKKYYQFVRR